MDARHANDKVVNEELKENQEEFAS